MTAPWTPSRRELVRAAGLLGGTALLGGPALAGCGTGTDDHGEAADGPAGATRVSQAEQVVAEAPRAPVDRDLLGTTAEAVTGFTADLYRQAAATDPGGNLVCSPYSVVVALAMTRAGARGRTATELDAVLHAPDRDRLHPGLNALTRELGSRAGTVLAADGLEHELQLDLANAVWGQRGTPWQQHFLATLARFYGAGIRQADFGDERNRERARKAINDWTADRTHDRITDLVPSGALDELTRTVLVNALYLKAGWLVPFEEQATADGPFRTAGGRTVTVPLMTGSEDRGYQRGDGWQAVDLAYLGERLAMAVVLPDEGRFAEVERGLDGPALRRLLAGFEPDQVVLTMPRWRFRSSLRLDAALSALGMPTAFSDGADFSGMTAQPLHIGQVLHQGFVAVDESGTEAAAATAVVMRAASAHLDPPQVRLDRPFLFAVHDVPTRTPLFVGRVTDPTAG